MLKLFVHILINIHEPSQDITTWKYFLDPYYPYIAGKTNKQAKALYEKSIETTESIWITYY